MAWVEPIFDRTQDDITNRTDKAFIQATDLNRIDGNLEVVAGKLGHKFVARTWNQTEYPRVDDWQLYLDAIEIIRTYGHYTTTPDTPEQPIYTYQQVNDLERIIYDVNKVFDDNEEDTIYTGEIYTGELIGVM